MKKKKKTPKRTLFKWAVTYQEAKRKADRAFGRYIVRRDRQRYGGICPLCRQRQIEVCFHFIPRGKSAVRTDAHNACGACFICNQEEQGDRTNPKWRAFHVALVGEAKRAELEQRKNKIVKISAYEYESWAEVFDTL